MLGEWPGNLQGSLQWSGVAQYGGSDTLEIFGSNGTLKYDFSTDEIQLGRRDDKTLTTISVPPRNSSVAGQ